MNHYIVQFSRYKLSLLRKAITKMSLTDAVRHFACAKPAIFTAPKTTIALEAALPSKAPVCLRYEVRTKMILWWA